MPSKSLVPTAPTAEALTTPQRAATRLQFGERFSIVSEIEVTPAGLLAMLLGSAVIVRAARRR